MNKVIAERYELKEVIGGGGMADVYLANDNILNRVIAVKMLRNSLAQDPIAVERFKREASAAAALSDKNIVAIYDVGEDQGQYFIVMEYVPGQTLKELIHKRGAVHVNEAIDIMKQVTSGVSRAHKLGIIHRDLKPQNILVTDSGVAKITDFGIASIESLANVTKTDVILGSLHYLAPEITRGEKASKQSDIYALGIVLYELLRGEVPFKGDSPINIAMKHLQEDIPSLREFNPSIPQSVENIVIKATAKNQKNRYATADEMLEDMRTCLDRLDEEKLTFDYNGDDTTTKVIHRTTDTGTLIVEEEIEEEDTEKKPGIIERLKGLNIKIKILLVSICILIAGVLALFISLNTSNKGMYMPNLENMTVEEATKLLEEDYGVTVDENVDEEITDNIDAGLIISSEPSAGTTIKKGDVIHLTISRGKYIVLENYIGQSYEDVKEKLEGSDYNMIVYEQERESDTVDKGIIIEQSKEAGVKLDPEEDILTITFTVSSGYKDSVPNVVGLSLSSAKSTLEDMGYVVETKVLTPPTSEAEINAMKINTVIKQSPEAFTTVTKKGTTVVLSYYDHKPTIKDDEITDPDGGNTTNPDSTDSGDGTDD